MEDRLQWIRLQPQSWAHWDPVRGGHVKTFPMNPPGQDQDASVPTFGVATPDGKRLLIGRNSGLLGCYDTTTGALRPKVSRVIDPNPAACSC